MCKRPCNPYICPLSLGQILASYEEFIAYYIDPCHNNLGSPGPGIGNPQYRVLFGCKSYGGD